MRGAFFGPVVLVAFVACVFFEVDPFFFSVVFTTCRTDRALYSVQDTVLTLSQHLF
jgi:hypothetical protein